MKRPKRLLLEGQTLGGRLHAKRGSDCLQLHVAEPRVHERLFEQALTPEAERTGLPRERRPELGVSPFSPSMGRVATFVCPARFASAAAKARIAGKRSVTGTLPPGPTRAAA